MSTLPTFPPEARCRGCRHWMQHDLGDGPEPVGTCRAEGDEQRRAFDYSRMFQAGAELRVEDTFPAVSVHIPIVPEGGILYALNTRADFGCVLWRGRS